MILVKSYNFAVAHYKLVHNLVMFGDKLKTDYDKESEPESLDSPVAIEVQRPWDEPVFSKCVYDSRESLLRYRDEVVYGSIDHLASKLSYTYHDRFCDQLGGVIDEIKRNPYTRRAQWITWQTDKDLGAEYPPCHQRGWIRVKAGRLDLHTTWRSRDIFKAWGSNVFAFAHLHKWLAEQTGYPPGDYLEWIDSAHIYGRDIEAAYSAIERDFKDWEWRLDEIETLP